MANRQKQRIVSKKHVARLERERSQSRLILYITISIVIVVIALIGYGVVNEAYFIPRQPIATVGEDVITTKEFQTRTRYERLQLVNEYINTYQFMEQFSDESTLSYFQNNLQQLQFQLEPAFLGQGIIDALVNDRLIRQEASRRGINVSEEEIDEAMTVAFGFYPDGTPTPIPTQEILPTSTLSPVQLTLVPPTPTMVDSMTETLQVTSEPTEDPEVVPTEIPPTPTPYTAEQFEQNYKTALTNLDDGINLSEDDFRLIFENEVYFKKVFDVITADLEQVEDQVWARHILVEDEETAQDVIGRLDAGEDFAALAGELSTDTGSGISGGDLGWFGRGRMVAEFEDAAFSLDIGEISEPVESGFGWHIIQLLGQELRPVDTTTFETLRQQAFQEWLDAQREAVEVVIIEDWGALVPVEPTIPAQLLVTP